MQDAFKFVGIDMLVATCSADENADAFTCANDWAYGFDSAASCDKFVAAGVKPEFGLMMGISGKCARWPDTYATTIGASNLEVIDNGEGVADGVGRYVLQVNTSAVSLTAGATVVLAIAMTVF